MLFRQLGKTARVSPPPVLAGRKVWVPRISVGSARAAAAVFRSLGVDAECTPPSDGRTSELGARYTCGDECYPTKVTLGDFLKVLEKPGADQNKIAFFMATGQGPCRFGQYVPYMRSVFDSLGYSGVTLLSPAFETGYSNFGEASSLFVRSMWRALVAADTLLKRLLMTRPYEVTPGTADSVHEECVADLCRTMEIPYSGYREQMDALRECLLRCSKRFRSVPVSGERGRPLIGVVGEIFCRLNTFSNEELVRRFEAFGAEVWMNDIGEWIWYTNSEQARMQRMEGKTVSMDALSARIRAHFQKKDEHELVSLFSEDFRGYEEPEEIAEILQYAEPYLPVAGASGEMVVNVGKSIYFARKGLDGVIDISPFTCMNGIICEAIYPRVSRDHAGFPIRNFYFDGTQSDLERDIGIYLEIARNYQRLKPWPRPLPSEPRGNGSNNGRAQTVPRE
jgi:predicted nucleotide-binding protein (sugar kinase/HSP70/actin superfamily)